MSVHEKPKGSLISFMANKVKAMGGVNLAQGIPSFEPPVELLQLLSKVSLQNCHQYAPGKGNSQLLEQLSLHYSQPISQFLIVNGATEAISTIVSYILKENPGSGILSFNPVYESYKHLPRLFNVPFVGLNGEVDLIQVKNHVLENNIKIILLASPGNPLGKIFSKEELDSLVKLAEELDIYLIIDGVYSDLYFDEEPYYPILNLSKNVFYVNAFSKKLSITGWRIGYLMSHESHMAALMDVHDYIGLSSPSVLQEALAMYLKEYRFGESYVFNLRKELKNNYLQMRDALQKLEFEVLDAQGGYFVWCKLPKKFVSGFDFAIELYEKHKVAVVPGEHFDAGAEQMIRINIARQPYEISMAVDKIKKFIGEN